MKKKSPMWTIVKMFQIARWLCIVIIVASLVAKTILYYSRVQDLFFDITAIVVTILALICWLFLGKFQETATVIAERDEKWR